MRCDIYSAMLAAFGAYIAVEHVHGSIFVYLLMREGVGRYIEDVDYNRLLRRIPRIVYAWMNNEEEVNNNDNYRI